MSNNDAIKVREHINELFAADRAIRDATQAILRTPHAALIAEIRKAVDEACEVVDEEEQALRLSALATLLPEIQGPGAIDLMIDILSTENEEARSHVGFSIIEAAQSRLGEVQKGIERALERLPVGSPGLVVLPYVMLGMSELDVCPMLRPFLAHEDPEAVAAAIDVSVELEDERVIPWLEALVHDQRKVRSEEDGTIESQFTTIAELAEDAIRELHQLLSEESDFDGYDSGDD